jgi:hypothetical protein
MPRPFHRPTAGAFLFGRISLAASLNGLTIVKECQGRSNRGNFSKASSSRIAASWRHGKGDRQIEALFALGSRERGTRSPRL